MLLKLNSNNCLTVLNGALCALQLIGDPFHSGVKDTLPSYDRWRVESNWIYYDDQFSFTSSLGSRSQLDFVTVIPYRSFENMNPASRYDLVFTDSECDAGSYYIFSACTGRITPTNPPPPQKKKLLHIMATPLGGGGGVGGG